MVGWHHWLDGHEFEQALGVSDGQGSLVCCSPRGHKQSDMTEWLKWTEILFPHRFCNLKMNEHTLNLKRDEVWGWLDMVIHYSLTQSCPILCDPMNSKLSFTVSSNLLKLMSIESMMPSNRLVLSPTSLPALSLSEHKGFSNDSALYTRWPEYSNFSLASVLPMNIQGWFSLGLTGLISLLSKGLSGVFSSTIIGKLLFFDAQPFLWSNSHICPWLLEKP